MLIGLALWLVPAAVSAAPPKQLVRELALWRQAVASQDPARIAGRLVKGQAIDVIQEGVPDLKLDQAALRKRLEDGQADALGLSGLLMLPQTAHLKPQADGRWQAESPTCPEVRWIFAKRGARWRLTEIHRQHPGC